MFEKLTESGWDGISIPMNGKREVIWRYVKSMTLPFVIMITEEKIVQKVPKSEYEYWILLYECKAEVLLPSNMGESIFEIIYAVGKHYSILPGFEYGIYPTVIGKGYSSLFEAVKAAKDKLALDINRIRLILGAETDAIEIVGLGP